MASGKWQNGQVVVRSLSIEAYTLTWSILFRESHIALCIFFYLDVNILNKKHIGVSYNVKKGHSDI